MPPIAAPARPIMAVPNRKFSDIVLALLLAVPLLAAALVLSRDANPRSEPHDPQPGRVPDERGARR